MSPFVKERGYADRLADYVDVKDRIRLFYEAHPDGRLVTADVVMHTDATGKQRVQVKALAYRTPDDPLPAVGYSWMELPGSTPYTRGSELENTETSAWGRAIGALGIGIKGGIASKDEIAAKSDAKPQPETAFDAGLVGIAEQGKGVVDFELRQTPTGHVLMFRLVEGRRGMKVIATDALAEMVAEYRTGIEGQRVTCWGTIEEESFDKGAKTIHYQVLQLSRLKVGALDLSAPEHEPSEDEDALIEELGELMPPVPLHKPA